MPADRRPNGTMLPGHTANRGGRPRKSRNLLTLFDEKRDEKVSLKLENGRTVKMSRMEAWVTNLWNKAIALDPKASLQIMAIMRASGQLTPSPEEADDLDPDNSAVLDALIGRLIAKAGDGEQ